MSSDIHPSRSTPGSADESANTASTDAPRLGGIHHVRIPVSDVNVSADWYSEVLGLQVVLVEEEENEVIGTVFSLGEGPSRLGLHHDPTRAAALAGFCVLAITVDPPGTISGWDAWLTQIKAVHSPMVEGPLGKFIDVSDPDRIIIQLHTPEHPTVEES